MNADEYFLPDDGSQQQAEQGLAEQYEQWLADGVAQALYRAWLDSLNSQDENYV